MHMIHRAITYFEKWPYSATAVLARFSIAAIFWQSGQTKIEGLAFDFIRGEWHLGWPTLTDSTLFLFTEEYNLPLIAPAIAALMATVAEHIFPIMLLMGFATRFAALALLLMTLTIQIFVYPDAYATHGVWATGLLLLMAKGAGRLSIDAWLHHRLR